MKGIGTVVLAALLALPAAAAGQQKVAVEITTKTTVDVVQKNEKGERVAVKKDVSEAKVVPGDIVTFSMTYSNKGKQPATGVVITDPVPEHMSYVDKSAEGKGTAIDFSVDGGKTYGSPEKLRIKDATGKTRPALAQDYTHVRWVVKGAVAPGGSGTVSFKTKVK